MKRAGVWVAPVTRTNSRAMLDTMADWPWDPQAREAAERAALEVRTLRPWPEWFTFKTAPMRHQRAACEEAYALDAFYLEMEQGTGKSHVVINVSCAHRLHERIALALIVAPNCVLRTWEEEIAKHCSLPYRIWRMSAKLRQDAVAVSPNEIGFVLASTESLSQGHTAERLSTWTPSWRFLMYVDEAHYIKTGTATRTGHCIALGRRAQMRLAGSGTQLTKSIIDLYAQYEYLDPNIIGIGDYYSFRNRYCEMGGFKRKEIVGYNNIDELMGFLRPFTYSILKKDCLDLPDKVYERRYVDLTDGHAAMYAKMRKGQLKPYAFPNVLAKTLRLRQLLAGLLPTPESYIAHMADPTHKVEPFQAVETAKNAKIQALLADVEAADGQAIIFCQWRGELSQVEAALNPAWGKVVVLTGGVKPDERQERINAFQRGEARFFLATIDAGGIGITLTAASTVYFLSHTDNYAKRLQAEDRAHRIGTKHKVTYIDYYATGTVDELLLAAHEAKQDLAEFVKGKMREGRGQELEALL